MWNRSILIGSARCWRMPAAPKWAPWARNSSIPQVLSNTLASSSASWKVPATCIANTFGSPYWNWLPFTRNVSAVTGACLVMLTNVFIELGGFDETFPVNYNDVDLCLRARQAGYDVVVEPGALLRHYECQSRQAGVRLAERYLFEQRWAAWLERGDPFYSPHLHRTVEDAGLELNDRVEPPAWR